MNGSQSTEKPIKGEEKKWGGIFNGLLVTKFRYHFH